MESHQAGPSSAHSPSSDYPHEYSPPHHGKKDHDSDK